MRRPRIYLFIIYAKLLCQANADLVLDATRRDGEHGLFHENVGVLKYVNPLIGTRGGEPNDNGGMIPSVAPPFAMTRWTPQTRENFISQVPYSDLDRRMHGFQATHQPAIWMGENGPVVLTPGIGHVKPRFEQRGLKYRKEDEKTSPYVYEVLLDADSAGNYGWNLTEQAAAEAFGGGCPPCPGGEATVSDEISQGANGRIRRRELFEREVDDYLHGPASNSSERSYSKTIRAALAGTSHVGHLRFDFEDRSSSHVNNNAHPYVYLQASRLNWTGHVEINPDSREVSGSNSQRQDYALGPDRARSFRSYFVSRFSEPFVSYGTTRGEKIYQSATKLEDKDVGAFVAFNESVERVEVRTGVSFVSVEQARFNLDNEIPDGTGFEATVESTKSSWLEKLGRVIISGVNKTDAAHDPRTIFYTSLFHALQYPNDFSEVVKGDQRRFYSGYTDSVHEANDSYYQSWSIWDTYRAEQSLLTLFAPERVNAMMRSLIRIFDWSGRLPIWANVVETNIMIATNADVVLSNALSRGFRDFDVAKAWDAVRRNAYEPPENDTKLLYFDREPYTPHEARAGLTSYLKRGWVDNDGWSESASRTLDYAFNDFAAAIVASHAGDEPAAKDLSIRAKNYRNIWNNETQFMQARNANGSWANETWGWTEGDRWVYTFDVMHDVSGLAELFQNGEVGLIARLDEHFAGGHNLHSNEPSHHVPYLYSQLGAPGRAAEEIRKIAWDNYNATASGLSGNEDLGQMSAWYVFSAMGFYPVNPAGNEYIVASPFFDRMEIKLPAGPGGVYGEKKLVISAVGASNGNIYVAGLKIDGREVTKPVLTHEEIVGASLIEFEMSSVGTDWGMDGSS